MLGDAADKVVGYADVERAADTARKDVDVVAACSHLPPLGYWVARSSRAMTVERVASQVYSPACSLRGRGNSSGVSLLTTRAVSAGASVLLKSSSSIRPARFSILSAEIRIWRTSS